jgi:hypothetical protein
LRVNAGLTFTKGVEIPTAGSTCILGERKMFKSFFAKQQTFNPSEIEFELAMKAINERMDKMLGQTRDLQSDYVGPERRASAYQLR